MTRRAPTTTAAAPPRPAGTSGAAPASPAFSSPDIEAAVKLAIGPAVHAAVQATLAAMAAAGGAGEGAGGAAAPAAASPEALAEALKPVVEALQVRTVKRAQEVLIGCKRMAAAAVCISSSFSLRTCGQHAPRAAALVCRLWLAQAEPAVFHMTSDFQLHDHPRHQAVGLQ